MGCVQSYFKRAHNAGISPSSTQESNSKQPVSEDGTRPVQEERSITEEPESNDTSYGVEATAVRTLAATTGTVAILGTTAKTEKKGEDGEDGTSSNSATPAVVDTIPEEQEEVTVNVEKAVIHEENKEENSKEEEKLVEVKEITEEETKEEPSSKFGSKPNSKNIEDISEKKETIEEIENEIPPSASTEVKEDTSLSTSPVETNKSPVSDSIKSERLSPNVKSPVVINEETESKKDVVNSPEPVSSESIKDKEEDVSKSISSERLKTNSISNTTLSSDSIVEFDNNSVKQSPSTDKVIESFDSSSTVEFVDTATKEILKQEGNKSNPARSISSDLSNKANLPLDGEKTPDVLSPEEQEKNINDEDLPPPPPALEEEEVLETPAANDNAHSYKSPEKEILDSNNKVSIESQNGADSSLKDHTQNDETSLNSEFSLHLTNSTPTAVQNEPQVQDLLSKGSVDNTSSNDSVENNKAESGSLLSSDNNSSLYDNEETVPSPVTAVSLTPAPVSLETESGKGEPGLSQNHREEVKSDIIESNHQLLENHKAIVQNVTNDSENTTHEVVENIKEEVRLSKTESILNDSVEINPKYANSLDSRSETPNNHAAEKCLTEDVSQDSSVEIKTSLEKIVNGLSVSKLEGAVSENAFESPIDLSDDKVLAAATTIQASFRGFQTRQNLKSTAKDEEQTEKLEIISKESDIEQTNTTNITSPKTAENVLNTEHSESILENVDGKMVSAATTIQANFRGFQTRQMLKSNVDSGLAPSEETNQSVERRTPTALTPELIESVKEEVNDICKEAEVIAAERSESVEGMLRGVEHVVVGTKETALPSVSDSILAVRGSATPPSVSEAVDTDEAKEEVFDSLTDFDETTINAATTIQATFRGYQARKALQDNTEQPDSMPDYPPPDEYLEDLPPPDFEALESSYSEDVPTEPLVPPPPPDSEIFNEEDEDELVALQRPQECDELPEHRLTLDTESEPSDSSLSSAATKIQAGVRGYLTRKQIQTQGGTGTGTTSTSTNRTAPDSDGSLSVDGMRSAISTEEESEVTRHRATPDSEGASGGADPRPGRTATKRMSLAEPPTRSHAPIRSRALSVQVAGAGPIVSDEEVWNTLKSEMADAATKIQSNFRGYRARKQLQREDAIQGTSSSSQATPTPTSGSVEAPPPQSQQTEQRTSGEYHDIIALTPPHVDNPRGEGTAAAGSGEEPVADQPADAMVKRRASDEDAGAAAAATKIQATFRGFKTRQEMKDVDRAAAKIQAGFRGYKVRKEMKRNGESGVRRSSNPEGAERHDPQTEKAATKIQAGVRGFLVRRRVQRGKSATQQ